MRKQQGFGVTGIILAVAVIALVGVIGWRVYDASKSQNNKTTNQKTPGNQTNTGSGTQQTPPADTDTYLDIKELGIKIKLSDSIKDATYSVKMLSDGSQVAYFSTQSLVLLDSACSTQFGPLGSIVKSTTDTDRMGAKLVVDNQSVFKFGVYYFTYSSPQALCSDKAQSTVNNLRSALARSLPTMRLDR